MAQASAASAVARVEAPGGAVDRGAGRLDPQEHVGEAVLQRLEGADRPAERGARVDVRERHLEAALHDAEQHRGGADGGEAIDALEQRRRGRSTVAA